jgi:hypothetical protein
MKSPKALEAGNLDSTTSVCEINSQAEGLGGSDLTASTGKTNYRLV